jgi:hypothetical protein
VTAPRGKILGRSRRLRNKNQLGHKPSGWGKGKWHSRESLWNYKRKARRKNKIAAASRKRNRA